jgi:hypothetical protein
MAVDVIIDPSSGQIYWNDAAGSGTQTIAISGNATNAINVVGYSNFFSPGGGGLGTQILATFNDSATSTFTPGTNAYDLGSTSLRWNFYGTGGNFTGVISTSSSTASTNTTTGALTVAGGLGVVGDVFVSSATGSKLSVMQSSGDEGGEIFLNKAVTNTTITTGITIDVYQNRLRFFETGGTNRGAYLDLVACSASVATNLLSSGSGSGISNLNGLTATTQTFATGTSGTDFNISSSSSTHTFNIPYAGSGATGLVTTQAQTIAGVKTFSGQTIVSDSTASTTTGTGALLVYGGLGVTGQINSASLVTSGNVVVNGNLQFKGVGTFGDATSDTITSLARYASDLLPSADNTYDLGNNSLGWRNFRVSGVGTIATLAVTSSTASTNTTTGALVVTGGVGIGGTINAGPRNLSYTAANLLAGFATSVNTFAQIVLQNASTGATASSDFIVNNDQSTDATFYGAMGMNSSGYTGSGSFNLPNAVYFTSTSGDLVLGSTTANILRFVYNSGATDSMQITGTAVSVLYNTASTSTSTGALTVIGGVGIGGSLWTSTSNLASVSGVTLSNGTITGTLSGTATSAQVIATTTDTSSTLYILGSRSSTGFAGTAVYVDTNVSIVGNTITANLTGTASIASSSVNLNTTSDTTSTLYLLGTRSNGGFAGTAIYVDTGISALGNTITATTFSGSLTGTATTATRATNTDITLDTTSTIYLTGSRSNASIGSTPVYVLSGVSALGNTITATTFSGTLTGTASIATSSVNSATTTDTSSTLYLIGSRSSTGFAGTALYVDSSISILGSQVTAGVWGGTAISAVNGGTGQNTYTIGDILYASSTTALSKLSAGTAGSVLTSNGAGAAPSYKAAASGGSPAGSSSWLQYNNSGAFGATSYLAYGGNGNNDFVISAPYSGATQGQVNIGLGITGFDGVTLGKFAGSASGTVIAANQASGFTGNFADFQLAGSSKFTIGFDGKITVVGIYSLPTTAGTAGSVLTSNGTGNQFYWSAPGASGGGAGTVASGTANQVAIYAATGASVSGAANLTYNTTSVTVANTTASNNNSSGALLVYGGIGASGQISGAGASFTSTVFLNGIRIGQGGNNITFTDSAGTTIGDFNTSNGWLRSAQTTQSTTSGTGALVSLGGLGVAKAASIGETVYALSTVNSTSLSTGALIVSGGAGFAKTIFVGDNINIFKSGSVGALRLWNSANSFYTGLQAGNPAANTTYTLPITFPGTAGSTLISDTSGVMSWAAPGGTGTVTTLTAGNGISFSTGSTITTTGTVRRKTSYNLTFMSGYTPTAAGVDTVVLRVPESAADGGALIYNCREVVLRVETPSAGTSTINVQKYAGGGITAFSTTSTGSTTNILSAALSITGATTYEASSSTFAAGHGTVAGGDKLRINFTALNATHNSFNISLLLEEQ